jgi:hypothetical protein
VAWLDEVDAGVEGCRERRARRVQNNTSTGQLRRARELPVCIDWYAGGANYRSSPDSAVNVQRIEVIDAGLPFRLCHSRTREHEAKFAPG